MCRAAKCRECGKTTWAGCGQHITEVKRSVPSGQWCPGHEQRDGHSAKKGLLRRLFGR